MKAKTGEVAPFRFRAGRAIAATGFFLSFGLALLFSSCSDNSSPTQSKGTPQITDVDTLGFDPVGYTTVITVEHMVVEPGGTVGPIAVPCGAYWNGAIIAKGGDFPYTYAASNLPAGMTVSFNNGQLSWTAPCAVAGQTFNSTLTVMDKRQARSPAVTASFLVQSSGN